jgi:hypothetical protein
MKLRLVVNNDDPLINAALALLEAKRRLDQFGDAPGGLEALWDVCDAREKFHKEFVAEVVRKNECSIRDAIRNGWL